MQYNEDTDIAFDSVQMASTHTCTLAYFEPDTFELLKQYMGVPTDRDLYLKVVSEDDDHVVLQPSVRFMGKMTGFYKVCFNQKGNTMQAPLEVRKASEDCLFGKSDTVGFLRMDTEIEKSRIVIQKPRTHRPVKGYGVKSRPEPVTVTRYVEPVPVEQFTPKAMKPPALTGFRRVSAPVVYECERTGERLEFDSDAAADMALRRRGEVGAFCDRHGLKFELSAAWVKALMKDDHITF